MPGRSYTALLILLTLGAGATAGGVHNAFGNSAPMSQSMPRADQPLAGSVLGIEVRVSNKAVGRLIDLLARPDGKIEAAVVEYGGFLGIGSRRVAVDWSALSFERHGQELVAILRLTADHLRNAPEYKAGQPAVIARER